MDNNSHGESNQGFDNQIISVPPDSVDQFSVVDQQRKCGDTAVRSGATINVASQSGGNKFHATVFIEFIRNTDLNAPGFFKPTNRSPPRVLFRSLSSPYHRNQYGGNFEKRPHHER